MATLRHGYPLSLLCSSSPYESTSQLCGSYYFFFRLDFVLTAFSLYNCHHPHRPQAIGVVEGEFHLARLLFFIGASQ